MKQKFLLFTVLLSSMWLTKALANESEPNNDKAHASALPLNGSNSGKITTATDVDWYQVTTDADGRIDLTLSVSNGLNAWFALYDYDGTTLLHQDYTAGTYSYSVDGLAAGTYYVKIFPYYPGELPYYTISDTLVKPAVANDTEPDSTRAQALVLPLNGSKTGHISYLYNNHRDSLDVYKVTTNFDGALNLALSIPNGTPTWFELDDNDAKTLLRREYTTGDYNYTVDGLAAGTYYVKVYTYYNYQFAPYTLSDSLIKAVPANDPEPDSTRAQALTLPLNGSATGHIGYLYNNHRDSLDVYKVTTNLDGALNLALSIPNGTPVWFELDDNDAKTLLHREYTTGDYNYTYDGLAAGTYYVKVYAYYSYQFAPYTLSNTLIKAVPANDTEPDSTRATALVLPLNGSKTGHVGYFYKNHRDSIDVYKLTTNADGAIRLSLSIPNGTPTWFELDDNDANTLLYRDYTTGNYNYTIDGLAAGTYYIKVYTYYNTQFAPYTLSDTLLTYNPNDAEPNKYAKQARTLNSDQVNNGHVSFYYNNMRDSVDWFKINYTGNSGNMSVTLNVLSHYNGGDQNTYMEIYADTTASPLFSNYTTGSITANLVTLNKGYYYVKVFTYYNYGFSAYTITPTFTQTKAKISTDSYDSTFTCDDNMITYALSSSHAPYSVQLYRFKEKYGNAKTTNNKKVSFTSLPDGVYYASVYGDGATGPAKGISDTVTIMPIPQNPKAVATLVHQTTLTWDTVPCAAYFVIRYRLKGTEDWTSVRTNGNVSSFKLQGLMAGTAYQWQVAAVDTANNLTARSANSLTKGFVTDEAGFAQVNSNEATDASAKTKQVLLAVAPNPANNYFIIRFNAAVQSNVTATLFNTDGKAVWTSGAVTANALNNKQVITNRFGSGMYYLKITDAQGLVVADTKVSIAR